MRAYRVRRPKEHDSLMKLLSDSEHGVFSSLKSVMVFSAALGFKEKKRIPFTETGERIDLNIFSERDRPFIYCLALTEFKDVSYLKEDKFEEVMTVFEEYAHGGLSFLDGYLDKNHIKESLESYLFSQENDLVGTLVDGW